MYVTYETNQYYINKDTFTVERHTGPPKLFPSIIPKSKDEFMPTKLVRVSDMKVVKGSTVKDEGYCALSYSWSWSGENNIVQGGKSVRVDNGEHQIIFPPKNVDTPPNSEENGQEDVSSSGEIKYVMFEGIIQQMCKDFNINYIWFDQMCINQEDKEEKHREIKQMHRVYGNAYCTIVHVPELETEMWSHNMGTYRAIRTIGLSYSDWMQRMWTLEEAMISKQLLFVGKDTYMLGPVAVEWASLGALADKPSRWNAATVLYFAHSRDCTNAHDRVFALANLYPHLMDQIDVNYKQDLDGLLLKFYGMLAQEDLSVLCFGEDGEHYKDIEQNVFGQQEKEDSTILIRNYDLPSWTGINGQHELFGGGTSTGLWKTTFKNYSIDGRFMKLNCTPIWSMDNPRSTINIDPFAPIDPQDMPYLPEEKYDLYNSLGIKVHFPGSHKPQMILARFHRPNSEHQENNRALITKLLALLSLFMPIDKEQFFWIENQPELVANEKLTRFFLSLTEPVDYSAKYAILYGIPFKDDENNKETMYPVVRQDGDYYKAIGHCLISNAASFFSDNILSPEQTFIIH
ncbi:hypothetical protein BDC45DRAFT_570601 [Circinella umbellata]|nr:hypothetical protein BDC45DRAFT_570601 [Circinella umbellata]